MQDDTNNPTDPMQWNEETREGNPLGGNPQDQMSPEDVYNATMAKQAQFVSGYATQISAFARREHDRDVRTGSDGIRTYVKRLEDFQTEYEKGNFDEKEAFDLVRKTAKEHALSDRFFYESFHEGAWDQSRSMVSDEHNMLLGTDMRARNQYIHDSSQTSELAGMLGLRNSREFLDAVQERGIDASQEGSWSDTLTSLISLKDNALFNYENLIDDLGKRKDPEWDSDARDNAWSRMNATDTGQEIVRATGMTREALDRLPNQDSLIYVMNRKWKEAKFAQHASQDAFGGWPKPSINASSVISTPTRSVKLPLRRSSRSLQPVPRLASTPLRSSGRPRLLRVLSLCTAWPRLGLRLPSFSPPASSVTLLSPAPVLLRPATRRALPAGITSGSLEQHGRVRELAHLPGGRFG